MSKDKIKIGGVYINIRKTVPMYAVIKKIPPEDSYYNIMGDIYSFHEDKLRVWINWGLPSLKRKRKHKVGVIWKKLNKKEEDRFWLMMYRYK